MAGEGPNNRLLGYSQPHQRSHQPKVLPAQPRRAQGCTMEGGNPNQGHVRNKDLAWGTPRRAISPSSQV